MCIFEILLDTLLKLEMTVIPTPSYTRRLNKFLPWRSAYKIVTLLGWAYEENKCSHNTCLAVMAIVPRCTLTAVTPKCIHTRGPVFTGFSFAKERHNF